MSNVTATMLSSMLQSQMPVSGRVLSRVLTDMRADLREGESVTIRGLGEITIRSNTSSVTTETPEGFSQIVPIDQDKYFSISLTDKRDAQDIVKMAEYSIKAAQSLAFDIDKTICSLASSAQKKIGDSSLVIGATEVYSYLSEIFAYFAKERDTEIAPTLFAGTYLARVIKQAFDIKSTDNAASLKNGYLGNFQGFDIVETAAVVNTGTYAESGSTLVETSFAIASREAVGVPIQNMIEAETLRDTTKFADIYRGRCLYGAKIIDEKKFCSFICKPDLSD